MDDRLYEVLVFYKYRNDYSNPSMQLHRYKDACRIRDEWNSKITSDNPHFGYAILQPSYWL